MPQPILAVGVDPAKRLHRAVAVLFPDQVILDVALPNACDAVANLDDRLVELANQHGAELVYGLEDHRRYGRLFCQVLTERELLNNPESRRRQYALVARARTLGWENAIASVNRNVTSARIGVGIRFGPSALAARTSRS